MSDQFILNKTAVVLVGACAVDTILTVPNFPKEDEKLRATSHQKRRGGNSPNTLEVLHQLVHLQLPTTGYSASSATNKVGQGAVIDKLAMIAVLPSKKSPVMPFNVESFKIPGKKTKIDFTFNIHREDHIDPISSYIISSKETGSRTIVNHNSLPEMTDDEFECLTDNNDSRPGLIAQTSDRNAWYHFEGRNPLVTLNSMVHLKNIWFEHIDGCSLIISVELEKPGREHLQEMANCADVVFYSKSWAEGQGYKSAEECLQSQANIMYTDDGGQWSSKVLICAWGKEGASMVRIPKVEVGLFVTKLADGPHNIVHSPALSIMDTEIVDAVGAGDTFIAGMIYCLVNKGTEWSPKEQLKFANTLAGRKIKQQGFSGLAEQVVDLL